MILNKGGAKRKNINGGAQPNFEMPVANSTIMGQSMNTTQNNMFLNETDQFFNDPFQQTSSQNYYQPNQTAQSNGFYDFASGQNWANNQHMGFENQVSNQMPQIKTTNQQPNFSPAQQTQQHQVPFFNPLQPNNLFNDPVASMAVKYGSTLADQGKEYVTQNDWSVKYSQGDVAVPPKLDVNAPDMYIPVMAFVTYILMVGVCLGTQDKFSPEKLGILASSALGWFMIEVFLIFITLQILSIKSALKTFDIMAFCGYKYFGMILCLIGSLLISKNGYYIILIYMCVSFTYFMVRNLKIMILTNNSQSQNGETNNPYENNALGNKRRIYVLLFISLLQPFFMWWLTYSY